MPVNSIRTLLRSNFKTSKVGFSSFFASLLNRSSLMYEPGSNGCACCWGCSRLWRRVTAGRARPLRACATRFAIPDGVRPWPSRPDAAQSRRARPRAFRRRLALNWWLDSRLELSARRRRSWQRLGLVVASSHARGRTRRPRPCVARRISLGGRHAAVPTCQRHNKPLASQLLAKGVSDCWRRVAVSCASRLLRPSVAQSAVCIMLRLDHWRLSAVRSGPGGYPPWPCHGGADFLGRRRLSTPLMTDAT